MKIHSVVLVALAGLVAADFDPYLHDKYQMMSTSSFIEYFNAQDYPWKMAEYNHIKKKHMGYAHFDNESLEQLPLQTHDFDAIDLPENFDAREKWPQCETIKDIYLQGDCNSCWAFGTAMTASDRTCIHKDIHVRLSEQDLGCCNNQMCDAGSPPHAFNFWKDQGLVTQECKPYNISELKKFPCVTKCVNEDKNYEQDKHFGEIIYRVSNESDQIKAELVKNGPIEAEFVVYEDFRNYTTGVYVHKVGNAIGVHSVRVIGYGIENGLDYWLAANSWGESWGDHGFFKIKSYQKDVNFENYLTTGIPKN